MGNSIERRICHCITLSVNLIGDDILQDIHAYTTSQVSGLLPGLFVFVGKARLMRKFFRALLASIGIYWYQFEEATKYGSYLEEARRELLNYNSLLIDTNDPSII